MRPNVSNQVSADVREIGDTDLRSDEGYLNVMKLIIAT